MINIKYITLLLLLAVFSFQVKAQIEPPHIQELKKFYKIGSGKEIFMPLGKISFADSIVSFKQGNPAALPKYTNPKNALGEPDYKQYLDTSYVSIGCRGELVVEFKDNGFIDIDGPDLYFFEIGPSIEAFRVEISSNNKDWIHIGKVEGGSAYVDIAKANIPEDKKEIYYYIKVTDLGSFCDGPTAGSDIDAIGTVGGVLKIDIKAHLLFDTDKYSIKEKALKPLLELKKNITRIPKAEILIEGHTDTDGGSDYNKELGKNRALEVKKYLQVMLTGEGNYTYTTESHGEKRPISTNKTQKGKQQNRRVEIIVLPSKEFYKAPR